MRLPSLVVPHLSSSLRKQGPIRRGLSILARWQTAFAATSDGGYGSLLSQGRRKRIQFSNSLEGMRSRSRRVFRARSGLFVRPSKRQRAQGKPGARRTRGLACKNVAKNAHEHTGSAEAVRPSLRNGFTAYSALSPVTGFVATVMGGCCRQLDASTGASGPHAFAVRLRRPRQEHRQRPPHPAPRS